MCFVFALLIVRPPVVVSAQVSAGETLASNDNALFYPETPVNLTDTYQLKVVKLKAEKEERQDSPIVGIEVALLEKNKGTIASKNIALNVEEIVTFYKDGYAYSLSMRPFEVSYSRREWVRADYTFTAHKTPEPNLTNDFFEGRRNPALSLGYGFGVYFLGATKDTDAKKTSLEIYIDYLPSLHYFAYSNPFGPDGNFKKPLQIELGKRKKFVFHDGDYGYTVSLKPTRIDCQWIEEILCDTAKERGVSFSHRIKREALKTPIPPRPDGAIDPGETHALNGGYYDSSFLRQGQDLDLLLKKIEMIDAGQKALISIRQYVPGPSSIAMNSIRYIPEVVQQLWLTNNEPVEVTINQMMYTITAELYAPASHYSKGWAKVMHRSKPVPFKAPAICGSSVKVRLAQGERAEVCKDGVRYRFVLDRSGGNAHSREVHYSISANNRRFSQTQTFIGLFSYDPIIENTPNGGSISIILQQTLGEPPPESLDVFLELLPATVRKEQYPKMPETKSVPTSDITYSALASEPLQLDYNFGLYLKHVKILDNKKKSVEFLIDYDRDHNPTHINQPQSDGDFKKLHQIESGAHTTLRFHDGAFGYTLTLKPTRVHCELVKRSLGSFCHDSGSFAAFSHSIKKEALAKPIALKPRGAIEPGEIYFPIRLEELRVMETRPKALVSILRQTDYEKFEAVRTLWLTNKETAQVTIGDMIHTITSEFSMPSAPYSKGWAKITHHSKLVPLETPATCGSSVKARLSQGESAEICRDGVRYKFMVYKLKSRQGSTPADIIYSVYANSLRFAHGQTAIYGRDSFFAGMIIVGTPYGGRLSIGLHQTRGEPKPESIDVFLESKPSHVPLGLYEEPVVIDSNDTQLKTLRHPQGYEASFPSTWFHGENFRDGDMRSVTIKNGNNPVPDGRPGTCRFVELHIMGPFNYAHFYDTFEDFVDERYGQYASVTSKKKKLSISGLRAYKIEDSSIGGDECTHESYYINLDAQYGVVVETGYKRDDKEAQENVSKIIQSIKR